MGHIAEMHGFLAYPSAPSQIGQSLTAAVQRVNNSNATIRLTTWEENDIVGRFLAEEVLSQIESADFLIADVTHLNFNVTFEIGYAIGKSKRVLLIRNSTLVGTDELMRRVGIFDTLGFEKYSNTNDLVQHILDARGLNPLPIKHVASRRNSPVFLVQPRERSDNDIHLASSLKKSRLQFRSYDPAELGRLPASEAIEQVAQSHGVVTLLLPSVRVGADVHNMRVAFVAGLAMGMDIELLLLQEGDDPVPLDYRDLVRAFRQPTQIDNYIGEFATEIAARLQSEPAHVVDTPQTFLERVNLGASAAENELRDLSKYYVQTDEFRRVLRGEARVVTGRKGAGKTAVFFQVRDRLRSRQGNVVLDLRPEGFQLLKFKQRVLDYLDEGTREHTITAFWEYLLLLEICYRIIDQDEQLHLRDSALFDSYRRLRDIYYDDHFVTVGDFSERMLALTQRIADDFESNGGADHVSQSLSSGQITDMLYKHDIYDLRNEVLRYLRLKESLWVLFDNLDKGWPAHGVTKEDVLTLRCLIDALGKLEQLLARAGVDAHGVVFIRNDVYELLVADTPDRGKVSRVMLDWADSDLLRELLRRRFIRTQGVEKEAVFDDLWIRLCCTHYHGEETSQYLIDRCLMRPRGLIELVRYCRSHAVNLGRRQIAVDDIRSGEASYSEDLLVNIGYEISDVVPGAGDLLYEFVEAPKEMVGRDILSRLSGAAETINARDVFEILIWYGIFGVVVDEHECRYIYDANYDVRKIRKLAERRGGDDAMFRLNPAFWSALEIRR